MSVPNLSSNPHSFVARSQRLNQKDSDADLMEDSLLQLLPILLGVAGDDRKPKERNPEVLNNLLDETANLALEELLGRDFLVQLGSLAKELNPDLQCKGFVLLGEELARQGKLAVASLIFVWLQKTLEKVNGEWAGEYRSRVEEDMRGLSGEEGPSSLRTEVWFSNLSSNLVDPTTLAGFMAGEATFRLLRFNLFKNLQGLSKLGPLAEASSLWRNEKTLWRVSTLSAAAVEPFVFTTAQHGVRRLLETKGEANASESLGLSYAKNALTLGSLRLGGFLFQGIGRGIAATAGFQNSALRDFLWERAGSYFGLVASARVLHAMGLDPATPGQEINDRALGYLGLSTLNRGLWTWVGRGLKLNVGTSGKF